MTNLLVLPILIPAMGAALSLLLWRSRALQRAVALGAVAALLAAAGALLQSVAETGIAAVQVGDWPAPYGITLVADVFSAIMAVLAGFMGLAVVLYSFATIDAGRESYGYYPLLQVLLMGVCGAFLTGDLFNLYVWFEVLLMASFVLLALGGERAQMEGAIKYVTLNLISSALFLAALGILYGIAGTLNMADLAVKLRGNSEPGLVMAVTSLFFIAFGIKAAVFPLFFWLPASYHTPPVAVTALFSGLLTKVGVYSLIRTFTLLFVDESGRTQTFLSAIAGLTMITGVLGAVAQYDFRRLLSFHIVSQIGYLLMGLAVMTSAALAGAIYFMVHVVLSKSALFLVSGVVERLRGTYDLKALGGLYAARPWLAILFLIPALSLAGMPPLSGFFAKLALIQAGLTVERYVIVTAALTVGLLTLFSMIKIWTEVFWKLPQGDIGASPAEPQLTKSETVQLFLPIIAMALLIVALGLAAEPFMSLAQSGAEQLIDSRAYVQTVLEARR